jgi:uncharacterized iron-regulated protein
MGDIMTNEEWATESMKIAPNVKKWLDEHKLIKDESYNSELIRLLKIPEKEA